MRTQAEQLEIDQRRLEAEVYFAQLKADRQTQQQQFANFMGQAMTEQQNLSGKYNAMTQPKMGGVSVEKAAPIFSMPATPSKAQSFGPSMGDPQAEVLLIQKQVEQEREQARQKLHEVTSAAKQTVNEHFLQMASEAAKKEELARSAAAAAATTDEIRKQRGTVAWNESLTSELKAARETTKREAAQTRVGGSIDREQDDLRRRKKDPSSSSNGNSKTEGDVDASMPQGPSGPSGPSGPGSKVKKKAGRIVLPRNNPAQNTPSNQPTGAQVPGQHGAVMPNTTFIPANPAPTGDNTRADDKPLPVSMREGAMRRNVKKKILKTKQDKSLTKEKGTIEQSREKTNSNKRHQ